MDTYDALIIGGGFFGMYLGESLALRGKRVLLCEKESEFMTRASYVNQARVHSGYHYPRSILTAMRSQSSFRRFVEEFPECIDDQFESYYPIGRILGKVTATQFHEFCQRIGARCEQAPDSIRRYFNPQLIEDVFSTTEYAFDAVKLRDRMKQRLEAARVECRMDTEVLRLERSNDGFALADLSKKTRDGQESVRLRAAEVFNCTYCGINRVLIPSGLPVIPLKHELTEICLVKPPRELAGKAFTVMCGPFFSVMPFPSRGLYSFTHVRYTPHFEWSDDFDGPRQDGYDIHARAKKASAWRYMIQDARRYMPILEQCEYRESLWEVKTILPRSETDDSRPILFRPHHGMQNLCCILGGKIDNVYDAVDAIEKMEKP